MFINSFYFPQSLVLCLMESKKEINYVYQSSDECQSSSTSYLIKHAQANPERNDNPRRSTVCPFLCPVQYMVL